MNPLRPRCLCQSRQPANTRLGVGDERSEAAAGLALRGEPDANEKRAGVTRLRCERSERFGARTSLTWAFVFVARIQDRRRAIHVPFVVLMGVPRRASLVLRQHEPIERSCRLYR